MSKSAAAHRASAAASKSEASAHAASKASAAAASKASKAAASKANASKAAASKAAASKAKASKAKASEKAASKSKSAASAKKSKAAATKKKSSGSSGTKLASSDSVSGEVTYYYQTGEVNCPQYGSSIVDSDLVVAISTHNLYGSGSYCGKFIDVTNPANGNTVTVKVVDSCEGCTASHLDLSPTAFLKLGALSAGVIDVTWSWA